MAPALALAIVLWVRAGIWLPLYGLHKLETRLYDYFKSSLFSPIVAGLISIMALWLLSNTIKEQNIHWIITIVIYTMVVLVSFVAVSLRKETTDLLFMVRNRFNKTREL